MACGAPEYPQNIYILSNVQYDASHWRCYSIIFAKINLVGFLFQLRVRKYERFQYVHTSVRPATKRLSRVRVYLALDKVIF